MKRTRRQKSYTTTDRICKCCKTNETTWVIASRDEQGSRNELFYCFDCDDVEEEPA